MSLALAKLTFWGGYHPQPWAALCVASLQLAAMGELLPLLSSAPLADILRSFTDDDVYASLGTTCSQSAVGPCITDALQQARYWHGVWLEHEGEKIMQAAEDAALDAFVRRQHHAEDYYGPAFWG